MPDVIYAPWTETQVSALNQFQQSGIMHPFTCRTHSSVALTATERGWHCAVGECDYLQQWADPIMANSDWLAEAMERRREAFGLNTKCAVEERA